MKILNVLDGCLLHLARARACSRLIPPVGDIFGGVSMVTLASPKWNCCLCTPKPEPADGRGGKTIEKMFSFSFLGGEREGKRPSEMEDDFPKKKSFSFIRL